MADILLEVCVDNAEGLQAALDGGADRIELCSALELGGLTPSFGFMRLAAKASVPVYAMIRPRAGDFVFGSQDVAVMLDDIDMARRAGLAGVVLGANLEDGRLDEALLAGLVSHAQGLGLTLHRSFDRTGPEFGNALETAIDLGFERILTSGGAPSAIEGVDVLQRLFTQAAGRIVIMPGAGVNTGNSDQLVERLALTELHGSCSGIMPDSANKTGFSNNGRKQTDANLVRALKAKLAA